MTQERALELIKRHVFSTGGFQGDIGQYELNPQFKEAMRDAHRRLSATLGESEVGLREMLLLTEAWYIAYIAHNVIGQNWVLYRKGPS